MSVIGIIAEYNPFHLGHKHQIDEIRKRFGEDSTIVAVMSSNLTQRGEVAIFDKADRAKAAVMCGVNLALELPFPYSMAGAQFFAEGGVGILDALGAVDYLSFGSECADLESLSLAADILSENSDSLEEGHDSIGYAKKCEELCRLHFDDAHALLSPNNILGIEYIKAINKLESSIVPTTLKREGCDYLDKNISEKELPSAMAIRERLLNNDISALDYTPKAAKDIFSSAIQNGSAPCLASRLDAAVVASFRLNSSPEFGDTIHDAGGGLYNRIKAASFSADCISSLTELAKTKKYTTARIRRAIWFSYFGVTSSDVRQKPTFTQVLGVDEKGAALLKRIKKTAKIPILTKPSAKDTLAGYALASKALSDRVDSVLQLTKPDFVRGDAGLLFTPFVKSGDILR